MLLAFLLLLFGAVSPVEAGVRASQFVDRPSHPVQPVRKGPDSGSFLVSSQFVRQAVSTRFERAQPALVVAVAAIGRPTESGLACRPPEALFSNPGATPRSGRAPPSIPFS